MRNDINKIVSDYLTGSITDEDLLYMQQRIESDDAFREKVMQLMQDDGMSRAWHIYNGIDDVRAMKQLRSRLFPSLRVSSKALRWVAAAAVVLVLVVGSMWYVDYTHVTPPELASDVKTAMGYQTGEASDSGKQLTERFEANMAEATAEDLSAFSLSAERVKELVSANKIETQRGKEHWLTLDDGTVVHLGNNTRLIYPDHFATRSPFRGKVCREVYLEGEAYFMVAKDKSRPFVVHTLHGDVRDYGTEFYVSCSFLPDVDTSGTVAGTVAGGASGMKKMEVVLVSGSVGVVPETGKGEMMLAPGQRVSSNGESMKVDNVDIATYQAWNTGTYAFEGTTLESMMEVIGRWYDLRIEFASEALKNKKFDGVLSRYDTLDNVLHSISIVMNLNISLDGKTVRIEG